jgi:hypothetical protein
VHAEEVGHVELGEGRIALGLAGQDLAMRVHHLARHERREIGIAAEAQDPGALRVVHDHRPALHATDRLGGGREAVLGPVAA